MIEERGRLLSAATARRIAWIADDPPDLRWVVRVSLPFDYGYSKNAAWRSVRRGYVYLTQQSRILRATLASAIRDAMSDKVVAQGKLWIDILVQKPDHKGDAVNFVDSVCDAVKQAVGLDDRWFAIRRLDWQVVKVNPRLMVGIGQDVAVDHKICSSCGRERHLDAFHRNRSTRDGRARQCIECTRGTRKLTAPAVAKQ